MDIERRYRTMQPISELANGLPNLCGSERQVEEVMSWQQPVYRTETNLNLDRLQAAFAIALHMQQPLIPAGGGDLRTADLISNLDFMLRGSDNYNATMFMDCYGRIGDIVPDLVRQ